MNTFANILPLILVAIAVIFASSFFNRVALSTLGLEKIANDNTRRVATAGVKSFVFVALFAAGMALIGNPYTLGSFFVFWGVVALIEFVMPSRT